MDAPGCSWVFTLHALPEKYLLDKKPCQQQLTNQFVNINGQNINILYPSGSYGAQNGNGYHTSYHYQQGDTQKRSLPASKSSFRPLILTICITKSVKPVFRIQKFLGLLDPGASLNKQKINKKPLFLPFSDYIMTFIFED
jgi:hypothetical protein